MSCLLPLPAPSLYKIPGAKSSLRLVDELTISRHRGQIFLNYFFKIRVKVNRQNKSEEPVVEFRLRLNASTARYNTSRRALTYANIFRERSLRGAAGPRCPISICVYQTLRWRRYCPNIGRLSSQKILQFDRSRVEFEHFQPACRKERLSRKESLKCVVPNANEHDAPGARRYLRNRQRDSGR